MTTSPIRITRRSPLALASIAGLAFAAAAGAQQQFPTYIGPVNGNYNAPGNWSGGLVPTNGNGGFTFGPLFPAGVSVNSGNNPTVDKLQLNLGATLRVNDNTNFTVLGDPGVTGTTGLMSCRGTFLLNSGGNSTDLRIGGNTVTFGGTALEPGVLMGSNTLANRVYGIGGNDRLVIGVGGLVAGSMQLGLNALAVTNMGEIRASSSAGISFDPNGAGVINTGIISADGGTMSLFGGTFNSAGGTLVARNGSVLSIFGLARIEGGTLATVNGGIIHASGGAAFAGSTVTGQARLLDNSHCFFESAFNIASGGTFTMSSGGNVSDIRIAGNTTITGPGLLNTSNTLANRMYGVSTTDTVTFAGGLTLSGAAQLGVNGLNFIALPGTVVSASLSAGVTIDPSTSYLNRGTLRAESGAVLGLSSGTFDNNGTEGLMVAEDGSRVDISASTVLGGTVDRNGSGLVRAFGSSILSNVVNTGFVQIPDNNNAQITGTFTNSAAAGEGFFQLASGGNVCDLRIIGNVTVNGGGSIIASNTLANRVYATDSTSRLTNAAGHTIRGAMQLGLNGMCMTNAGLVLSEGSAGLIIDMNASGMINTGTIRSGTASSLSITGSTVVNNTGGIIDAAANSTLSFTGASRTVGGQITGPGTINANAGAAFENVTNQTTILQSDNTSFGFTTAVTNNGVYRLNSAGNVSDLQMQGDVTINGTGSITSSNTLANRVYAIGGVGRLTNASGHTIRGSMQLGTNGMSMTNNGLVVADLSGGILVDMNGTGMINNGIMRADASGTLSITGSTLVSNALGRLESLPGGHLLITGGSRITGGLITGAGAVTSSANAVLENVSNFATIAQPDNNSSILAGSFMNQSIFRLNSGGNVSDLQIEGDVTVSGVGSITSSNTQANRVYAIGGTARLTNASGHTIRGTMNLGANFMALTNEGAIIADQSGGMTIDPSAGGFQNTGLLQRTGPSLLNIVDGFTTSGTVQCDAGGTLRLSNGAWPQTGGLVIADGTIDVTSRTYNLTGGLLGGNGTVVSNLNNTGGTVDPGTLGGVDQTGTLILQGNYVQGPTGNFSVRVGGVMTPDQNDFFNVQGTANLNGTITINRENGFVPNINQAFTVLGTVGTNSRTGTFTTISSPDFWNIVYLNNAVVIVFNGLGPDSCGVDFNNDGFVEPGDLDEFITSFFSDIDGERARCDFNNDGFVEPGDLDEFLTAFFEGC